MLLAGLCLVLTGASAVEARQWPGVAAADFTRLNVYFNNDRLAPRSDDCGLVFPVQRVLPVTVAVATAALTQLFAGPSEAEQAAGYRSPFSATTAGLLRGLRIVDGTAHVDLHDPRELLPGASSSCGAAEFQAQIEQTLTQFGSVRRVVIAIDGDPRTFYDWMGGD